MTDLFTQAARTVAEVDTALNTAAEKLAAAHEYANSIRTRRQALEQERDNIAAARRTGAEVDGARLAVIALDLADLDLLLASATAAVATAQAKVDEARAVVTGKRSELERIRDSDMLAKLEAHASQLGALLHQTMTEITATNERLSGKGARPTWYPTAALAYDLHRLDLMRPAGAR